MLWVSAQDKLPEVNQIVVFYYNDENHIGYYCGFVEKTGAYLWRSRISTYNCVHNVNYWIPLPEEPKEEICTS
jgi:hypothetical protein